jgi:hypothetical protein
MLDVQYLGYRLYIATKYTFLNPFTPNQFDLHCRIYSDTTVTNPLAQIRMKCVSGMSVSLIWLALPSELFVFSEMLGLACPDTDALIPLIEQTKNKLKTNGYNGGLGQVDRLETILVFINIRVAMSMNAI